MTAQSKHFVLVKKILADYNFSDFVWVYCRPTVVDLFKRGKRCGIYVLRFKNDHYYVGQAVDVIRRYIQHTKVHDDIQELSFKCVSSEKLNKIEQELIKALEGKNVKLRNINLTSFPKGDTDLDLIVSKRKQEDWLKSYKSYKLSKQIIDKRDLKDKYTKKFSRLLKRQDFRDSAFPFLKEYFSKCVLQPAKTELSFWSLTCLTKVYLGTSDITLCRLNFFWCEVLTIWVDGDKKIRYSFHLTKSLLTKGYLKSLRIKSLAIFDHFYQRGGPDQFSIEVQGINDAMKLLRDKNVVAAIKTFNLRQMQKGATVYGRYHCIDLAKMVLSNKTPHVFNS
jgi:hypothetical protein